MNSKLAKGNWINTHTHSGTSTHAHMHTQTHTHTRTTAGTTKCKTSFKMVNKTTRDSTKSK